MLKEKEINRLYGVISGMCRNTYYDYKTTKNEEKKERLKSEYDDLKVMKAILKLLKKDDFMNLINKYNLQESV